MEDASGRRSDWRDGKGGNERGAMSTELYEK